jgi:hypothetical protein
MPATIKQIEERIIGNSKARKKAEVELAFCERTLEQRLKEAVDAVKAAAAGEADEGSESRGQT